MTIKGPLPVSRVSALSNGCAAAKMTRAASTERTINNQSGVCAALSSRVPNPNINRTGGKRIVVGNGGVNFNSHQITGKANSPVNAQGTAKKMAPKVNMA
jgi:hypothetical protein